MFSKLIIVRLITVAIVMEFCTFLKTGWQNINRLEAGKNLRILEEYPHKERVVMA